MINNIDGRLPAFHSIMEWEKNYLPNRVRQKIEEEYTNNPQELGMALALESIRQVEIKSKSDSLVKKA